MARQITIEHSCGHRLNYVVRTPPPPERHVSVPVMCPECEHEANLLTCTVCGQQHSKEDCVLHPASFATGRRCTPVPAATA